MVDDLDPWHGPTGLAGLAEHGSRTANLGSAELIRRRAAQRRTRRRAAQGAAASLVVVAVGSAVAQQGLLSREPQVTGTPTVVATSTTPSATVATTAEPVPLSRPVSIERFLDGTRQLVLLPAGTASAVTFDSDSRGATAELTSVLDPRGSLVAVEIGPGRGKYLLKTGGITSGGEPLCLVARSAGAPVTLQACDAADGDAVWQFEAADQQDAAPTYRPRTSAGLSIAADGPEIRAVRTPGTPLYVADTGKAQLPTLD